MTSFKKGHDQDWGGGGGGGGSSERFVKIFFFWVGVSQRFVKVLSEL